jgi:tetratricopeptide (TPR) repeat protein
LKARINLANLLRQEGRLDEAITQYRQAIRLQPRHAKAHYNLALTLQLIGNLEEALMHAETAAKHEPSFAEYQNAVGNIVQELRRTENATRP